MEKNIFQFDKNKCVGCQACAVACVNENGMQSPDRWRNISSSNPAHFPGLPLFYLSLACNHCDDAPCMKNCPALAYSRDEATGAIIHHADKCIGCKYCTWACPYDAPKFNPNEGIVEKCTFCNHRLEEGKKPACANLCPTGALDFTQLEWNREEALESSPVPVKIGSSFQCTELRNNKGPEMDLDLSATERQVQPKVKLKISAKEEWPLYIFTFITICAVAFYVSKDNIWSLSQKLVFLGCLGFAALLSTFHLGKSFRAWRSVLNLKSSWLSREIFLFGAFTGITFIDLFFIEINDGLIAFIAFSLLLSIDMLYTKAHWNWSSKIHSAQALVMGLALFLLLSDWIYLFSIVSIFRLGLYAYRKWKQKSERRIPSAVVFIRVLGLVFGFGLVLQYGYSYWFLALYLIGEALDRWEYYNELNVPQPAESIMVVESTN